MLTVRFETTYIYKVLIPRSVPIGVYQVCLRVTNPSGNSARGCAPARVR